MKKVFSVILSALILAGSTGIAYGQHFCSGHLLKSEFAFTESALNCGMEKPTSEPDSGASDFVYESHCCDNHFYEVDFDHHFVGFQFQLKFQQGFLIAVLPAKTFIPFNITFEEPVQFTGHDPPSLPAEDFQSLYQLYLI